MDLKDLLILTLYWSGGVLSGLTRLHKLVFLLAEKLKIHRKYFVPGPFGPYAPGLKEALLDLEKQKLVYIDQEIVTPQFQLTKEGMEAAKNLETRLGEQASNLKAVISYFSGVPLTYLLAYIYSRYEEYLTASQIKSKVSKWIDYYKHRGRLYVE